MKKNEIDKEIFLLHDLSLINNNLAFYLCSKCGTINDSTVMKCEKCSRFLDEDDIYPNMNAFDVAYSFSVQKEIANKFRNGLIVFYIEELKHQADIDITKNDMTFLFEKYENMLPKSGSVDREKYIQIIANRLKCNESEANIIAGEILSGRSINRTYKPFVINIASYIELIFKDYMKFHLIKELGDDIGIRILNQYERKNYNDFIDLYNVLTGKTLRDAIAPINNKFYDKWQTLRYERNEIIHNNSITLKHNSIKNYYDLSKDAVLVFAHLRGNLIKT